MTESTLTKNIKTNCDLTTALTELRQNETLNTLYFTQEVMAAIKKIPRIKPPIKTVQLSSIMPAPQEEEPEQPPPQEKPKFYTKIRSRVKRPRTH